MNKPARENDDATLFARARAGDTAALNSLIKREQGGVSDLLRRLVGRPDDGDDLLQQSLVDALVQIAQAPDDVSFAAWLHSLAVAAAIDHLTNFPRWRPDAQLRYAEQCTKAPALASELLKIVDQPDFIFNARQHVTSCFVILGRSLAVMEHVAITLHDVLEFLPIEAAAAMRVSEEEFHAALVSGRQHVRDYYAAACSLQVRDGRCQQCDGLHHVVKPDKRGTPAPPIESYPERLSIVRENSPGRGDNADLGKLLFRRIEMLETHEGSKT